MPRFSNGNGNGSHDDEPKLPARRDLPDNYEPRCHVCQSQYRKAIDRLLVLPNTSYSEVQRIFDIDRRSISNHAKEHLGYEEAAIRRIIEHEAEQAQENVEDGIKGALSRRVFLNVYIQKTTEALMNGDLELTGKDAMAAIQMLDKIEGETTETAVDEMRLQFGAFTQAMREICTAEQWPLIVARTKQLLEVPAPQLEP